MSILRKFAIAGAAVAALATATITTEADAAAITGQLNMTSLGGVSTLDGPGGNAVSTALATYLDFDPSGAGGVFQVAGAHTGSFSILTTGQFGTIQDLAFNPFIGPIANFWSVGGFTFELDTIGIEVQTGSTLSIIGTGTVSGNNYDPTVGYWAFTTQNGGYNLSWSATTTVPVPAMLGLLGMGLMGLGAAARRRKAA